MGKRVYDWKAIQAFHDQRHSFIECQKEFGFTHTAWIKAIRRGELRAWYREDGRRAAAGDDRRRRYDWAEIQRYYDDGNSFRQCQENRIQYPNVAKSSPARRNSRASAGHAYRTAVDRPTLPCARQRPTTPRGFIRNECSRCKITEWLGQPLSMHLDHINGIKDDHRLENLRMLCLNCHSQTPTYGGKNMRLRRLLQDGGASM